MVRCIDCGLLGLRAKDGTLAEAGDDFRRSHWPPNPLCAARRFDLTAEVVAAWRLRTGETREPEIRVLLENGDSPKSPEKVDVEAVLTRSRSCRDFDRWIRGLSPAEAIRRRDSRSRDLFARWVAGASLLLATVSLLVSLLR